ncbi:hypothetical protein [Streptomyces sp. ADI98-10]|uniref:hypothetical protein n=1 Tax=Streptomyces sp. ADI98-10 TaxID=1522763 RepID=UPI000FB16B31|nr:hypothetical protein [Streptomyces sp. ADI98-10]RPK78118.1 hypothetical protein EES46_34465 [Streptomyces sp. ADI98-10]
MDASASFSGGEAAEPVLLEGFRAKQLRLAQEAGAIGPEKDPAMVAAGQMAMVNGLGSSVLSCQRTGKAALSVLRHHLDELFDLATPASDSS